MRFPHQQKLGRAGQFLSLRTEGRRLDTGPYVVWFRLRPELEEPRLGEKPRFAINASRRVGPAIIRNRMKRIMREAFRLGQSDLPPRCDVWIQLKHGCDQMRPEELRRRLFEAAKRFLKQGNRRPPKGAPDEASPA